MRQCPFRNCGKPIPDERFACGPHWFRLTSRQKATIHEAYADYLKDRIDFERLREIQQGVLDENQGAST